MIRNRNEELFFFLSASLRQDKALLQAKVMNLPGKKPALAYVGGVTSPGDQNNNTESVPELACFRVH